MDSVSAAETMADASLDFAFIDADHTYEAVMRDLHVWHAKTRPGGLLCGHDYGHPRDRRGIWGVSRAVNEFAAAKGLTINVGKGTIWWTRLPESAGADQTGCDVARVAVVIPTFGQHEITHAAVADLLREPVTVFVVDNAGDYSALRDETVLRPGSNLGWAAGCNLGMQHAHNSGNFDAYLLLNNDVRLSNPFVEPLLESVILPDAEAVGRLVGPRFVESISDLEHSVRPRSIELVHSIDGCCMMIGRTLYETIGPLDSETFGFYGFGVDVDYCIRAKRAGFRIAVCNSALLWHEHGRTAHVVADGREAYREQARTEGSDGLLRKYGEEWEQLCHSQRLRSNDSESGKNQSPNPVGGEPNAATAGAMLASREN